jgi:hypothetical protein
MLDTSPFLPGFAVFHYRFYFSCEQSVRLADFPGSAWRGAFGHALKKTVCVVRNEPCHNCLLKTTCAYSYVFETPPPPSTVKMRKYTASPHPFALRFIERQPQEGRFNLDLIIYGHGQRYFPFLVHAFQQAGQTGIGSKRAVFDLQRIEQINPAVTDRLVYQDAQLVATAQALDITPPACPEVCTLHFHSPIRIKQNGHNLNAERFNFGSFFSHLLRKISMLSYFHTDQPLETDFAHLTQQAREVAFSHKNLHWFDWARYSARQQTEMNMGGVVGSVTLTGEQLGLFWPYLWLGQWVQVGKATSMGLGHYSIEMTSLS